MVELMQRGGPIMWVMLVCSIGVVIIFFERLFHLHRAQIGSHDFLAGLYNILRRGNVAEAVSICEETPGPEAAVVRAAILHHDESTESISRAVREAGLCEVPRLERNMNLLYTVALITPMLGLLGTVLGMIETLMALEQQAPLVHAGNLSGGLWQALISTAAGLSIAIPAYAGYNFLVGRVEAVLQSMERSAAEILVFLATLDQEKDGQPHGPESTPGA